MSPVNAFSICYISSDYTVKLVILVGSASIRILLQNSFADIIGLKIGVDNAKNDQAWIKLIIFILLMVIHKNTWKCWDVSRTKLILFPLLFYSKIFWVIMSTLWSCNSLNSIYSIYLWLISKMNDKKSFSIDDYEYSPYLLSSSRDSKVYKAVN